ncbi:hypothetical protein C2862_17340 [Massilia sp. Mn16-1_5]|nr:hypothetical protein C2862_17340 [Massilia sp. Mn16-1_5]
MPCSHRRFSATRTAVSLSPMTAPARHSTCEERAVPLAIRRSRITSGALGWERAILQVMSTVA